ALGHYETKTRRLREGGAGVAVTPPNGEFLSRSPLRSGILKSLSGTEQGPRTPFSSHFFLGWPMRRHINLERFLIAWSLAWLAALALRPALQESEYAFAASAALIAVNATVALWTLTRRRAVLVALNCTQIVLFGVLSSQLY